MSTIDKNFEQQWQEARAYSLISLVNEARALSVQYDRASGLLTFTLRGGAIMHVPAHLLQGVADAAPELIEKARLSPDGSGVHWPELDADLTVQGLVAGAFGSRRWMQKLEEAGLLDSASQERTRALDELYPVTASPTSAAAALLGSKGGNARSAAKSASSRANGAKGGRPRKKPVTA